MLRDTTPKIKGKVSGFLPWSRRGISRPRKPLGSLKIYW